MSTKCTVCEKSLVTICPECFKCEESEDTEKLLNASVFYMTLCKFVVDMALEKESAFDFAKRRKLRMIKEELEKALGMLI